MNGNFLGQALRIVLSASIASSTPAFANKYDPRNPQTQADGGGGGLPPTKSPPVDFGGGSGPGEEPQRPPAGPHSKGSTPGEFGTLWGIDRSGREIYNEGSFDEMGRRRVFRFSVHKAYVQRGVIFSEGPQSEGKAQWARDHVLYNSILPRLLRGNLMDVVHLTTEGAQTRFERVYLQGRADGLGRELIMRPLGTESMPDWQRYHTGRVLENGNIQWDLDPKGQRAITYSDRLLLQLRAADPNKRTEWSESERKLFKDRLLNFNRIVYEHYMKAYPNAMKGSEVAPEKARQKNPSNYPEVAGAKDPLPPNRALVVIPAPGGSSERNSPQTEHILKPGTGGTTEHVPRLSVIAPSLPPLKVSGTLMDEVESRVSSRAGAPGTSVMERAYLMGLIDQAGLPRIFKPLDRAGKPDWLHFRVGVINSQGEIEWKTDRFVDPRSGQVVVNEISISNEELLRELRQVPKKYSGSWTKKQIELFENRLAQLNERIHKDYVEFLAKSAGAGDRPEKKAESRPTAKASADSGAEKASESLRPLPRDKSLVVAGPRVDHAAGSGRADVSSRYTEHLDRYSPKRLEETLPRSPGERAWMKDQLQRFARGEPNSLLPKSWESPRQPGRLGQAVAKHGVELPAAIGAFYIALGITAWINLSIDHPNNPAAWSQYIEGATDPVSNVAFVGFIAAAGGNYWAWKRMITKMGGPAALGKTGVQPAMFLSSLIVGALASTILSEFMSDPNSSKCLGFANLRQTGRLTMDQDACQKLYITWTSREDWDSRATEQLLPMFANLMVAGGATHAIMLGWRLGYNYLMSRQFIAAGIRSIKFSWMPTGGPAVKLVTTVGQLVLFLFAYQIADGVFGVGHWVKGQFITDWSFISKDPNGNIISTNRDLLFTEWKRLREKGFPKEELLSGSPEKPDILSLMGKYRALQSEWRSHNMADVMNAYAQWKTKGDSYLAMYDLSFDVYQDSIRQMSLADPAFAGRSLFDLNYLKSLAAKYKSENNASYQTLLKETDYRDVWKNVQTQNPLEFLVASMACGPEVEGYGNSPGFLGSMSEWMGWALGTSGPQALESDSQGFKAEFFPPRLVTPIDDTKLTVCEKMGAKMINGFGESYKLAPHEFPVENGEQKYPSLLDYVRANLRPSLTQGSESRFSEWWKERVQPTFISFLERQQTDYAKMLDENFLPALVKKDYKWCSPLKVNKGKVSVDLKVGFESYFSLLKGPSAEDCPLDANNRLASGQLNSIRDELRLYLAMQMDLANSVYPRLGPSFSNKSELQSALLERSRESLRIMDELLQVATGKDPQKLSEALKMSQAFLDQSFEQKAGLLIGLTDDTKDAAQDLSYQLALNGEALLEEALLLVSILNQFRR